MTGERQGVVRRKDHELQVGQSCKAAREEAFGLLSSPAPPSSWNCPSLHVFLSSSAPQHPNPFPVQSPSSSPGPHKLPVASVLTGVLELGPPWAQGSRPRTCATVCSRPRETVLRAGFSSAFPPGQTRQPRWFGLVWFGSEG